jgi:hypothetical protein
MNSKIKINKTINYTEPVRILYDLVGTTVTPITKNAYKRTLKFGVG